MADWNGINIALRLNEVKKVISGKGVGNSIHGLYKGKSARASPYKIVTKDDLLVPSKSKPQQVTGTPLKLDRLSANLLKNKYGFVRFKNGKIAISLN